MTNMDEYAREFEKVAKTLSKMRGNEILFEEDAADVRSKLVFDAMNGHWDELNEAAKKIAEQPDGARHLVRALNNVKAIGHKGMLGFVRAAFESLENSGDFENKPQKLIQMLDLVTADLRDGLDWMDVKAAQILESLSGNEDLAFDLWMHWCAATVRVCSTAGSLIELVGAHRPKNLSKAQIHSLKQDLQDDQNTPWDIRGAALYLMLGNRLISLENAQDYVDKAYVSFPLEALEGVEILALAVENDGAFYAEFDVIQDKLAQIRRDNLFLRDMPLDIFAETSINVMHALAGLPNTPLDIALLLQAQDKNKRMVLSAFIDETRRSEWFKLARKSGRFWDIAGEFFKHFVPENAVLREFSLSIVTSMLDNDNVDAKLVERWIDACESEDLERLKGECEKWITLVLSH